MWRWWDGWDGGNTVIIVTIQKNLRNGVYITVNPAEVSALKYERALRLTTNETIDYLEEVLCTVKSDRGHAMPE
jgi:hypothetical protein